MKVAFGVSVSPATPLLQQKDTQAFMDLVKMADDYGADAIGTFDTAFIGGDAYVRATLMAISSERARVGLRPTNPLTREPQVMASFLASIDSLTNGRAFMDIASGDSAVLNIGYQVATRARIEDYVTCGPRPSSVRAFRSRSAPKARRCCILAAGSVTPWSPARVSCPRSSRTRSRGFTPARATPVARRRTSTSGSRPAARWTRTATGPSRT
ncbi:MAG: hypothetical protein DMD81_16780 [Candidatus Rokuibacteriota bacterium]|nr:MAG: hypothetical protein DMD81_16780 [Candidatus Rokubacteria bacterium]